MGLFGNPKSPAGGTEAAGFEFGERKEMSGPLPVVDNLVETVQWLENARNTVARGGASCCLVVCAPNPIDGIAMELTVGEIANRFAHSLRSYDAIFRHGREKLLVALPHVKPSDAPAVLQRLNAIVARLPFKMPNQSVDISVTVSLGGVMMDSNPAQELINRADKAMDAARISGNHTCMWTADLH
ncbi:MAG: diguanylate cyclase [Alphaproteobacteria bacterium]|nr:diguanylate cyclase [Alphaproteobacteria bacterium]